jgi:VanZ family protein
VSRGEDLIRWGLRLAAIGALLALAVLSLVPGELRPHVAGSGNFEHLLAYLATGLLVPLGLPRLQAWRTPLLLVILAGLFEVAQIYVPHRGPGLDNWLASAAGAGAAAVLMAVVRRRQRSNAALVPHPARAQGHDRRP